MQLRHALLILAIASVSLPAQAGTPFSYDANVPLAPVPGAARLLERGVVARDISFTSNGHIVTGEIVTGAKSKSHPGILFVHWLGDPKTTNHTEFEADAIALARRGAVSLLVDTMWAKPNWFDTVGKSADADIATGTAQVIDLRRALDVLQAQPGVDATRLGVVAHDFGAMYASLLAGVDPRPKALVLMAAVPTMSEWYLLGKKAPAPDYAARLNGALDIAGSLSASKAKAYLFQFATKDKYVPAARAQVLFDAGPLPKGEFLYGVDHDLATPAADADRRAWLIEQLF